MICISKREPLASFFGEYLNENKIVVLVVGQFWYEISLGITFGNSCCWQLEIRFNC